MTELLNRTEAYQSLASAIVMQAVLDWREAMRTLRRRPVYPEATRLMNDCERFLCSEWCEGLSGLNGSLLLKKLREDFKHDS